MPARRHPVLDVTAAAAAGLRETMRRLGHQPGLKGDETMAQAGDSVTVRCGRCELALSAYIDHAAERVELTGEALRLRCEEEPRA